MLTDQHPGGSSAVPPPWPAPALPSAQRREPARQTDAGISRGEGVVLVLGCGLVTGIALGRWCRAFADSVSMNGVLADLASPWVAAAFVCGALVARPWAHADHRRRRSVAAGLAGMVGGALCLVVATIVYYGPARTGTFEFGDASSRAWFWVAAGTVTGAVFGAAGAVSHAPLNAWVRGASVALFSTVVVGEALFVDSFGVTRYGGDAHDVVVVVALLGLAVPLLLSPRRTRRS